MRKSISQSERNDHRKPFSVKKMGAIIDPENPRETAQLFWEKQDRPIVCHRDIFYAWAGSHYRVLADEALVATLYCFLADAMFSTRRGLVPYKPNRRAVEDVLHAFRHLPSVLIPSTTNAPCWLHGIGVAPDDVPDPANIISVENGLLNIENGARELLPHSKAFFNVNALPFRFDAEAKCPRWEQFVAELLPDDDEDDGRRELQKAFGYSVSEDTRQQKVFMLVGEKRSGKGTLFTVLKALAGEENVATKRLHELGERFGKESLIGKRLALFPDVRLSKRLDTAPLVENLLSISGEDGIEVQRKGIKNWTGFLGVRCWLASNEWPKFSDQSGTIASRFLAFHLRQSFYGREDFDLKAKLLAELPGILNWSLDGLDMLRNDKKFKQPAGSQVFVNLMESMASPVKDFISEECILGEGLQIEIEEQLFPLWMLWAEDKGHEPGTKTSFRGRIASAAPQIKIKRPKREDGKQHWVAAGLGHPKAVRAIVPPHADDLLGIKVVPFDPARRVA